VICGNIWQLIKLPGKQKDETVFHYCAGGGAKSGDPVHHTGKKGLLDVSMDKE
jgi:hypothetical protein